MNELNTFNERLLNDQIIIHLLQKISEENKELKKELEFFRQEVKEEIKEIKIEVKDVRDFMNNNKAFIKFVAVAGSIILFAITVYNAVGKYLSK